MGTLITTRETVRNMDVRTAGPGEPAVAVVACIHGNEPCGKQAIDRFLADDPDFQQGVKFIVANEEALAQDERCIDTDMNRAFPGDLDSELLEERLAAELLERVGDLPVLALHATSSSEQPFAIVTERTGRTKRLACATGLPIVVDMGAISDGGMEAHCNGVAAECGLQGTETAVQQARTVIEQFLAAYGVLPEDVQRPEQTYFVAQDSISKNGETQVTADNFEKVAAGEPFAEGPDGTVTADEPFYPVLMSATGYDDILGFRADCVGTVDCSRMTGNAKKDANGEGVHG